MQKPSTESFKHDWIDVLNYSPEQSRFFDKRRPTIINHNLEGRWAIAYDYHLTSVRSFKSVKLKLY
ncbi:unnamed protein product [Linum tenue]|uniref:Uncharacterized protein n=1 Tax=Linum tenue TaxID=586396 RepID=A0AAV0HDA7_9ROSI|nr:unnamed protein product [Linum tenue]